MALEARNSPYVFGIDLGTSNSAIAIYRKGETEVLKVGDDPRCPSVVYSLTPDAFLVGREARARLIVRPEDTAASVKREMGTDWVKRFANRPGEEYTATDLSAEILSRLVDIARQSGVDLRGTPDSAVICIPANFNDAQKTATREAGLRANLDVLWLLEEPVAAALVYAENQDTDQTILVYDLGGGTFDVAIMEVDATKDGTSRFKFLAKEGVSRLGGDDFDARIAEIAAARFQEETGLDLLDCEEEQGIDVMSLRAAQQKLKSAAEVAKIELSESESAEISIPNLILDGAGNVHNLSLTITRAEFNEAIRDLILQTEIAVERALESARLGIGDISKVLLAGGSTRIPLVKEMLTELFDGREPYSDENPDTVVARGAALYGAELGRRADTLDAAEEADPGDLRPGSITINNIVTHFLGIETAGTKFSCVVEKGEEIPVDRPCSRSKVYTTSFDNQEDLRIAIYQSDRKVESVSDEGVECIGEFHLTGIPPKPRGQEFVTVDLNIDQQNLLKVTATSSSCSEELEIQRAPA